MLSEPLSCARSQKTHKATPEASWWTETSLPDSETAKTTWEAVLITLLQGLPQGPVCCCPRLIPWFLSQSLQVWPAQVHDGEPVSHSGPEKIKRWNRGVWLLVKNLHVNPQVSPQVTRGYLQASWVMLPPPPPPDLKHNLCSPQRFKGWGVYYVYLELLAQAFLGYLAKIPLWWQDRVGWQAGNLKTLSLLWPSILYFPLPPPLPLLLTPKSINLPEPFVHGSQAVRARHLYNRAELSTHGQGTIHSSGKGNGKLAPSSASGSHLCHHSD